MGEADICQSEMLKKRVLIGVKKNDLISQADHEVTVFNKLLKELSYIKNSFISAIDLPFSIKDSTRLS